MTVPRMKKETASAVFFVCGKAAAALAFPKELCPPAAHIFYTVSRFLSHGSLFCAGRPALFRRGRKVAGRL